MEWLGLLIKYGPTLVNTILSIRKLIQKSPDHRRCLYQEELDAAMHHYHMTKDRQILKDLKEKLKDRHG